MVKWWIKGFSNPFSSVDTQGQVLSCTEALSASITMRKIPAEGLTNKIYHQST